MVLCVGLFSCLGQQQQDYSHQAASDHEQMDGECARARVCVCVCVCLCVSVSVSVCVRVHARAYCVCCVYISAVLDCCHGHKWSY